MAQESNLDHYIERALELAEDGATEMSLDATDNDRSIADEVVALLKSNGFPYACKKVKPNYQLGIKFDKWS